MPVSDIDVSIGKRLRRRRKLLDLNQAEVAKMIGVGFQQIQKYECGDNKISASRLFQLSKALEVNVNYFFDGLSEGNDSKENDLPPLVENQIARLNAAFLKFSERERKILLAMVEEMSHKGS